MQYVLGNMLNGAGGLNADGLSLDLQFAADKTLTARRGPTPVFTRGSTGTFVGSNGLIQSAAVNAARFDHDPVTLASRGLLIEESRTNSILQSENFGTTWAAGGCAVSVNTAVAPDGNTTADSVNITNANGHFVAQNIAVSASTAYTFSFWVKRGTATALSYSIFNNTGGSNIVGSTSYYNQTSSEWSRVSFTFTTPVGCTNIAVYILRDGGSTGTVLLWGAQLEAGSFPTSYIPTTTSSLARSADVCTFTGADFNRFYNSTSGTLLSEASISNLIGSNRGIVQVDSGSNLSVIRHVYGFPDGGFRSIIRASGDTSTELSTVLGTASTIQKRIIAYEGTSFASVTNGGAVATATRTMPTGLNAMRIGNLADGSFYLSGHIAAIRFYKKRLPNAKIVTLTA
jgi:hypothetical protein